MDANVLFTICNFSILPCWLLLIVAPRWKWSSQFITPVVVPCLLAITYLSLIVWQVTPTDIQFDSIADVRRLFENDYALVAGWVHYMAMDLFVGAWEVRDSQRFGIHHGFVIPCLILTCLFGPAGLLLYVVLRWSLKRELLVQP